MFPESAYKLNMLNASCLISLNDKPHWRCGFPVFLLRVCGKGLRINTAVMRTSVLRDVKIP